MVKEFEPEDPMELVGVELPGGDPDEALDAIVHEYLLMGLAPGQIMHLFISPFYAATHQIYRVKGEAYVKSRVQKLAEEWRLGWITGCKPNG